ncbi:MAG: class I SAM-dependent methyltransferase [Bacteroidota bacterium]
MPVRISSFNPKERFSNRVEAYLKYRPHYPAELIPYFKESINLSPDDVLADIGSGTGFLAELFLEAGNVVYGVEPNKEMREAGERYLRRYPKFRSIAGSAEQTFLNDHSIDILTAAQAFHWFERDNFRRECSRILRGKSVVCLLWNERNLDATPFLEEYEMLLKRFSTDYEQIRHDNVIEDDMRSFFGTGNFTSAKFPYDQKLDFDGIRGRLLSSSYVPSEDDPRSDEMLKSLERIFQSHQADNRVELLYVTKVYWGTLS